MPFYFTCVATFPVKFDEYTKDYTEEIYYCHLLEDLSVMDEIMTEEKNHQEKKIYFKITKR